MSTARVCAFGRRLITGWRLHKAGFHGSPRQLSVFEPDDVGLGPEIPVYETLNVHMKGYDFAILESYAKYVHNLADRLGLETDCWAVPPKTAAAQVFKPVSTTVEREYDLSLYERCVQIQDVPSTVLPVFIETAKVNMPEGLQFTVKEPDPADEEDRYIPDKDLLELQDQLSTIEQAREERRKK